MICANGLLPLGNRVVLAVVGAVVCGAVVVGGVVAPSWAEPAEGPGASEPTLLGGFSLGDQIEAMVDPRSGAFSFALPVAGVSVAWSSSAAAVDRSGLGEGWSIAGVAHVDTEGGVRVSPASGEVYAANGSVPSGLDGYLLGDVVFRQGVTTVPARSDGLRPAVEAAFELVELGGVRTFFSAAGDPLVRMDANGNRSEWEWQAGHRLVRAMDASGVVTTLDWSDPANVRVTSAVGSSRSVSGAIELDGGRVAALTDATGGRVHLGYSDAGLVNRIAGVSGAATEVTWQGLADGQVVVDGVRVVDAETGDELSSRRWSAQTGLASGWPAQGFPVGASAADRRGYATSLTDGASTIVSEFDANHLLLEREVEVTTRTGSLVVQRQAYTYPEVDGDAKLPPQYGQPTGVTLTHLDAAGGKREVSEAFEFDAFGRLIGQVSQDGTRTETRYDSEVPVGAELPMGLPVSQRTTTPDGLVTETRHELNPNRTAHVATETSSGTTGDAELTRTARKEYDVEPDGFVSQERLYPQGGAGTPVVTTHTTDTDLAAGTAMTSTTVAAGTAVAATSSRVVDLLLGVSLQETGPAGSAVSAVYDDAGRPVEQVDAGGGVTRIEHRTRQQHGQNATIVTRPDEVVTTTTTDVLGRVVKTVDNILDGAPAPGHVRVAETREYPAVGEVRVTDAWGATATATYDLYGRAVKTVGANGLTELARHDDVANTVTTALTPTGEFADAEATMTTRLDARGRVTEASGTRADGAPVPAATTTFDGLGRVTATSDGAGETSVVLDPYGNPATTTTTPAADAAREATAALTTTREFDAFGASTAKTLATEHETRHGGVVVYDELGRPRTRTDQDGATTTYEYTPDGLVASILTSYGQITRNEYAPGTRELTRTETTSPIGATVSTGYEYDPATGSLIAVFDPADRAATEIAYESDAFGNTTRTTYPDGRVIEHEYDEHGLRVATTDVAGNVTRFAHDLAGLVTAATQTDERGKTLAKVGYRYDGFGRMIEQSRGNGVTTSYEYTSANQFARETATRPDGTVVTERIYEYDPRGNLLTRTDTRPDPGTGEATTSTTAYRYDAYDILIGSTVHDGATTDAPALRSSRYEVSVAGDIQAEHVTERPGSDAEATTTRVFEYGPTGTLARVATTRPDGTVATATQNYDEAGNLTRALDGTTYTYNAVNQPVSVTTAAGESVHTGYWASGQRAAHTQPGRGAATVFHWDGSTLLNDTHTPGDTEAGTVTAAYLIGNARHARSLDTGASVAYFEVDHHGSVTELTDADANLMTSYDYTDYGVTTTRQHPERDDIAQGAVTGDADRNPFQYSGEYTDSTGTQHLQARTYDPVSMRMAGVDPEPRYNKYHYADLNPIMLADPTGRFPELPFWASAVIAGVGLLMAGVGLLGTGIGAYMTAVATAATASPTIGSVLALGAVIAVVTFDVVAVALDTADVRDPEFMDDDTAFILGAASAALGGVTMFVSAATRAIGRIDINKVMALGTSEASAASIVRVERRLVDRIARPFRKLGVSLDESMLRSKLNKWAIAKSKVDGGYWTSKGHHDALGDLRRRLDQAYEVVNARLSASSLKRVDWIAPSIGRKLTAMKRVYAFKSMWPELDLTPEFVLARKNLGRELESVVNVDTGLHVYPLGYRKAVLKWEDDSYGSGSFDDDNFFGVAGEANAGSKWHHEVE